MPEDSFSQITPRKLLDAIENAMPLQRDNVANGFVGLRVRWMLALRNATRRYDGVTLVIFAIGPDPLCLDLVSGEINADDYPDLLAAAQGDVFVVTATIKRVDTFVLLNILTVTPAVAPQPASTHMSENYGGNRPNAAASKENDEQILPTRPWLSRRIVGDGMLFLFAVDFFSAATGHWNALWVKGFFDTSFCVFAIWLFEYGTKVKKWTKTTATILAGTSLITLSAAMIEAYRLADETPQQIASSPPASAVTPSTVLKASPTTIDNSLKETQKLLDQMNAKQAPSPTPTPLPTSLVYSHITPRELMDRLRSAPPYAESAEEGKLAGSAIEWNVRLSSVYPRGEELRLVLSSDSIPIFVTVPDKGNEFLRPAKTDDSFTIRGVIKEIGIGHIELNDYGAISPGPASQSSPSPAKRRPHL